MTKIVVSIVSALLILFPFSSFLRGTHQQLSFQGNYEISKNIVEAINSNDIQAIEDMLSIEAKQRMEDPQKSISEFLQNFDGEFVEMGYVSGGSESSESGTGYVYKVRNWKIEVETSQGEYRLYVTWIIADTKKPKRVGMSSIVLFDTEHNILAELYY